MPLKSRWIAFVIAMFTISCPGASGQSKHAWREVVELPLKPLHISNTGQVSGATKDNRAAVWSQRGGLKLLPAAPGFSESEARGSNRAGDVVGSLRNLERGRAFVFRNAKLVLLIGDHAKAWAISDSDLIAGEAAVPGKTLVSPVVWKKEVVTSLGGCCGGVARGINRHGEIIGDVYDENGRYHAVFWDAEKKMHPLGAVDAYSSAVAVNDSGHVLVQGLQSGLVLYLESGRTIRLPIPNQQPADGRALNNRDEVVGGYGAFSDANRAFLWSEKEGFQDLNHLIAPGSGWKLKMATGINDAGQIVGIGDHNGKEDVGFLLPIAKH